jgi:hypothetical protein
MLATGLASLDDKASKQLRWDLLFPSLETITTTVEVEHFKITTDSARNHADRIFGFREPLNDLSLLRDS